MAHDTEAPDRTRVITWDDPAKTAGFAGRISGMDFFAKLLAGELPPPPVMATLGITLDAIEPGKAVFSMEPAEYHYNPIGVVHGGVLATLLDSCVGCAIQSALPAGVAYTTLEIKVNYLRATTTKTGRIRAEGTAIHVGRQAAVAEGRVLDGQGRVLATCSTTCIVFPVKGHGG